MALNIGIIGLGQMGQTIDRLAQARGHHIVARVGKEGMAAHDLSMADVLIEFTQPDAVRGNIASALTLGIPMVTGTTGWHEDIDQVSNEVSRHNGQIVYASNFSLGVQLFFKLNQSLAKMMSPHSQYQVSMKEIHHTRKKDAPSGTAVSLAEDIIQERSDVHHWSLTPQEGLMHIQSERVDPTPGTHRVSYKSEVDDLIIEHVAHSREGFALGAIIAAENIQNVKGLVNFADLI